MVSEQSTSNSVPSDAVEPRTSYGASDAMLISGLTHVN
jgi:hypothetical protein